MMKHAVVDAQRLKTAPSLKFLTIRPVHVSAEMYRLPNAQDNKCKHFLSQYFFKLFEISKNWLKFFTDLFMRLVLVDAEKQEVCYYEVFFSNYVDSIIHASFINSFSFRLRFSTNVSIIFSCYKLKTLFFLL